MDRRMIKAASDALGYEVDAHRVANALAEYEGQDTLSLKRRLRERLVIFEYQGARGVELAEEIDSLRIVLAARRVQSRER